MRNLTALVIVPAALLVVIGCDLASVDPGGGAVSETTVTVRGGVDAGPGPLDDGDDPAVISDGPPGSLVGTILLDGPKPNLAPLVGKGASKVDSTVCGAAEAIPDESLVVGDNGGLANVFVYLTKKPKGVEFDIPETQPFLDQQACIFKPHTLVFWSGVEFELKNGDKVAHNIDAKPASNGGFNENMPPGASVRKSFRNTESLPFQSTCAIHPWMRFWTLVVDHPFYAVTDAEGKFEIPNLPPGKHKFRVFQERASQLERGIEVVVAPGKPTTVEWKYPASQFGL
ncbi:MAG: carboxypeptidase regulatory-like domain-containing protein [Planctomycetota bacterium]|nr:carboxypeptidase regulatory-like domain-containing protein [Planctomycetota bacterium]MDA0918976.1 carboxypeptidase regulatory-like domain-containing protein [Planctomycetota bacterium]